MNHHVAVFTCPLPALVNPTFSIVATLIRRGCHVTYVTSERFAAEAAALGAEIVRCPRTDYPFNQDDDPAMPMESQYARDVITLAHRTFAVASPFYKRNRPDLIIYDSQSFAGMLIAEKSGARAVRMSNQFAYDVESLGSAAIPLAWREMEISVDEQANGFFAAHGSDRTNAIRNSTADTFYLYLRELQLSERARNSGCFYAARCIAERPLPPQWRRRIRRRLGPTALIAASTTYGQSPQYYKNCLLALSQLGWETMLAVSNSTIAEFDSLPANCQPVQDVPLAAMMPYVDLLICAAGMATAMEAAYHGLPMLMITGGQPELEAYANRFQEYGMGLHLSQGNASPEQVAQCAARIVADRQLHHTVARARDAVRRSAGAEELVNWIEEELLRQ